jgi:predicted ArsR family transcriptional regulator
MPSAPSSSPAQLPPDRLNELVGVLTRREIEARLLAPLVAALDREFGEDRVLRVLQDTVAAIARAQGAELAQSMGANSLKELRESLVHWTRGGALEIDVVEEKDGILAFNVSRCRYAEMYCDLGIARLGPILSCARDFALIEGFNPQIRLTRTQTLMEGAPRCDFRYRLSK